MSEAEKTKPGKEVTTASDASLATPPGPATATTTANDSGNSTTSSITSTTSAVSTTNTNSGSSNTSITKLPSKAPPPLPPPPPPPPKLLPPPAPVSRPHRIHEPPTETIVKKAFADFMKDPECLDKATDYLYESLLEDAVMGVYLEVQHSVKSGSLEAIEGQPEDDTAFKIVDTPNYDVFGMSTARKDMDCNCPNCDRLVAASRFAPHLEKCMGMGRKTSRKASRRLANAKEGNSSYFYANASDDDDDADRSSEKRRKKIQTSRTNGSKKNGKSS